MSANVNRWPPKGVAAIWLSVALGLGFLALYGTRLCPTLSLTGDSAELTTAAALWGVPHPPGYPLYTAIGHAFSLLPFLTVPWRVHLTSAVFHAGAVGFVCAGTFTLTGSLAGALAAGFALGMSRTFMLGSLYAEVFPLNDFFFACLMSLGLIVRQASPDARFRRLVVLAACTGLAFSHHLMIALAAPAIMLLVAMPLARTLRGHERRALTLTLAFLAPLALYALVPWAASRSPALSWGDVHDWGSFVRLVTRQDYGGVLSSTRSPTAEASVDRLEAFAFLVARSMGAVSIALAVLGLAWELQRQPTVGASLLLAFLVPGPLFAFLNALGTGSEPTLAYFERFTSMCHVPLAIAAGSGVAWLQRTISKNPKNRHWLLALGGALGFWVLESSLRVRDVDLSEDRRGLAFAHDLVLQTPDRSLILLSGDEPGNAALYLCAVERTCGDRIVLSPGSLFLPWRMAQVRARYPELDIPWSEGPALRHVHELAAAAIDRRPVFIHPSLWEKDPALKDAFSSVPDRLLLRLWPADTPLEYERTPFLDSARAMTSTECEGCALASAIQPRPSQDIEIIDAYEAALTNHARAARSLAHEFALAVTLEDKARALEPLKAQGGWLSISR
jgi:dolichyl-phosphate-mannose-protein mannosyltransferase